MEGLRGRDTINSNEGKGFVTVNGKTRELFELLHLNADLEMVVSERKIMGKRMPQPKVIGAKGTGNIKMYFNNTELLKEIQNFIKTGFYPDISIQAYVNDKTSIYDKHEVVLRSVILNKTALIKLDAESEDGLSDETDFTFGDFEVLQYLKER